MGVASLPCQVRSFWSRAGVAKTDREGGMPETTSRFFSEELGRALQENGYALMSWEVKDSADPQATGSEAQADALVEVLPESEREGDKGRVVDITLTLRGYTAVHGEKRWPAHETLDDLLQAISPAYGRRRQKLLFAKLEDVAKSRAWD